MTFNEYQQQSFETAIYPNKGNNIAYATLGLCGESGEVAEKVKKILRDDGGKVTEEKREQLKKELGDSLWYIAAICSELKLNLDDVAQTNREKLQSRKERGVLNGSGDNR